MLKRIIGLMVFLLPASVVAQTGAIEGFCNRGGQSATVSGLNSTNKFQNVINSCTISVYQTGTNTLVPGDQIFSNSSGTVLGNPFTADNATSLTPGKWLFFISTTTAVDVYGSGGIAPNTYPSPVPLCIDCYASSQFSVSVGSLVNAVTIPDGTGQHIILWATNAEGSGVFGHASVIPFAPGGVISMGDSPGDCFGAYSCQGTLNLSGYTLSGTGLTCANVTSVRPFLIASLNAYVPITISSSPGETFSPSLDGPFAAQFTGDSNTTITCADIGSAGISIQIGASAGVPFAPVIANAFAAGLIVEYSGSPVPQPTSIGVYSPLYVDGAGSLHLSPINLGSQGDGGVLGTLGLVNGGGGATTAPAILANLLGNPSANTYSINCTSTTNCVPMTGGGGTVNVNGTSVSSPNFNGTTPAAATGGVNNVYQVSGSNVSSYTPAATGSTPGVMKPDGSTCTVTGGVLTCTGSSGSTSIAICADTSGSGTAQSCTTSPSFTPVAGSVIAYTTSTANSGTGLTVNVNSLGAKSVAKWQTTTTLAVNDVRAGTYILMTYDGTNWELSTIGNAPSGGGGGGGSSKATIIYDDDCANDNDCAVNNFPVLGRLYNTGAVNVLALIADSSNAYAAPAMHILASFYGMGNVPIGAWLGAVPSSNTSGNTSSWTLPLTTQFNPGDVNTNYPSCVTTYRTALAGAQDASVKIVATGFMTCLDALMQSSGDSISSLTGAQLIQAKVTELDVMGGYEPSTGSVEYNFSQDAVSAQYVLANWTSGNSYPPIYFSGFNNGAGSVSSGVPSSYPNTDPSAYVGSLTSYTRNSWDVLALYQAILGSTSLWSASGNGTNTVTATSGGSAGLNVYATSPSSGHYYLTLTQSSSYYQYLLNALIEAQGPNGQAVNTVNSLSGNVAITSPNSSFVIGTAGSNITADINTAHSNSFGATQSFNNVIITGTCTGCSGTSSFTPFPAVQTAPLTANFTNTNFQAGSASVDKTARMVVSVSNYSNIQEVKQVASIPSTPYTFDLSGIIASDDSTGYNSFGIVIQNSSTGALEYFQCRTHSSQAYIVTEQWNSLTSFSGVLFSNQQSGIGNYCALRVTDDGTTRKFYWSRNGLDFYQEYSEPDTTFTGTVNSFGIGAQNNGSSTIIEDSIYNYLVSGSVLPPISN